MASWEWGEGGPGEEGRAERGQWGGRWNLGLGFGHRTGKQAQGASVGLCWLLSQGSGRGAGLGKRGSSCLETAGFKVPADPHAKLPGTGTWSVRR